MGRGRRPLNSPGFIPENELVDLISQGLSGNEIAEHYNCTHYLIFKRLKELKITLPRRYKDRVVPRNKGIITRKYIKRVNIPKKMFFADPHNIPGQGADNVDSSLSLTQFGGYYELVEWGLVIHLGIDIYSRLILYLQVSHDNSASTVLRLFKTGVASKGLPARVRCENVVENAGVEHYMNVNRSDVEDRVIVQSKIQIGRFLRILQEVKRSFQDVSDLFTQFEKDDKLHTDNEIEIYCIRKCFSSLIQTKLDQFRVEWNNHRCDGLMTPSQLHLVGLHFLRKKATQSGRNYPELIQDKITDIDENVEWQETSNMSHVKYHLPNIPTNFLTEEQENILNEKFSVSKVINTESGEKMYRKMCRYLRKILPDEDSSS